MILTIKADIKVDLARPEKIIILITEPVGDHHTIYIDSCHASNSTNLFEALAKRFHEAAKISQKQPSTDSVGQAIKPKE